MVVEPSKDSFCSSYSFSECLVCPKEYHFILTKIDSGKNVRLCEHNSFKCKKYSENICSLCEEGYELTFYRLQGSFCKKRKFFKKYSFYFFEAAVVLMNLILAGYIMKDCVLGRKKEQPSPDIIKIRNSVSPEKS